MRKLMLVLALALVLPVAANAGFINITPGHWATFNDADTTCSKETKSNGAGEPVIDVVTCPDTGGIFQVTTIIPQNANPTTGAGWEVEYQWKCGDGDACLDSEVACMQASHIICVASASTPEDCEDLAFVNLPTNPTHLDMVTADIGQLVSDSDTTFLTASALEHGAAVNCLTDVCDGQRINIQFERTNGAVGDCTDDITGDIDIVSIIITYPED